MASIDPEYRVLTNGETFWVQAVSYNPFRTLWFGPYGENREDLLANWRDFNMALHKPILDARTGKEWGRPMVRKDPRAVDESRCK